MRDDAALAQLSRAHGVLESCRDMQGRERTASPDTFLALLAAISVSAESAGLVRESSDARRAESKARQFPVDVIMESLREMTHDS